MKNSTPESFELATPLEAEDEKAFADALKKPLEKWLKGEVRLRPMPDHDKLEQTHHRFIIFDN